MNSQNIIELLKSGKRPLVRLMDEPWEDSFGVTGMIARITSFNIDEDTVSFRFDYNENKTHNLSLQRHDYWLKDSSGATGTIFQAGLMKEDNITEDVFFMMDGEVPVKVLFSPLLDEYMSSNSEMTYVEWLEEQLTFTKGVLNFLSEQKTGESI